jgi:hypothetical protein
MKDFECHFTKQKRPELNIYKLSKYEDFFVKGEIQAKRFNFVLNLGFSLIMIKV